MICKENTSVKSYFFNFKSKIKINLSFEKEITGFPEKTNFPTRKSIRDVTFVILIQGFTSEIKGVNKVLTVNNTSHEHSS